MKEIFGKIPKIFQRKPLRAISWEYTDEQVGKYCRENNVEGKSETQIRGEMFLKDLGIETSTQ